MEMRGMFLLRQSSPARVAVWLSGVPARLSHPGEWHTGSLNPVCEIITLKTFPRSTAQVYSNSRLQIDINETAPFFSQARFVISGLLCKRCGNRIDRRQWLCKEPVLHCWALCRLVGWPMSEHSSCHCSGSGIHDGWQSTDGVCISRRAASTTAQCQVDSGIKLMTDRASSHWQFGHQNCQRRSYRREQYRCHFYKGPVTDSCHFNRRFCRTVLSAKSYHCIQSVSDFTKNHGFSIRCASTFNGPSSNVTVSKPSDEVGIPWTHLQARDYGKSIPVLQEPVTVSASDIKKFLGAVGMKFESGHTCFITSCPRVNKKKVLLEEKDKLYINMTTGSFICHACRKVGAYPQLQDNLSVLRGAKRKKDLECFPEIKGDYNSPKSTLMTSLWDSSFPLSELSETELDDVLHWTSYQGLTMSTLQSYGVRVDAERQSLLVPIYFVDNAVHAVKKISIKWAEDGTPKGTRETTIPRGDVHGLIGWNTIRPSDKEVVLTAAEVDAMAVCQETKVPAIALPKGDSILPQEILPLLEQFQKIVLWFNNDIRSWEAAKQFTKKLGEKRCFVIRPSSEHPNAHEALQTKTNLRKILEQARPVSHQSITAFSQLRQEVFSELAHVEQVAGVKWKRYPHLNKLLKGHRRGELTIFTGPTGAGKTTFISDYSLDLCVQGVNTLWGSFEINNVRLMKMMLTQFAQQNLSKNLMEFDQWADQFETLPMYFMTFYGQESIKRVIETMSHAVYVHDIAHVVVDNLQFMMGVDSDRLMMDRFQRQDQIVAAFRKFATTMNCHVTVVVHPRKEKDNDELTTASVYGSAKATQEADNVLILQDKRLMSVRGKKYLQVAKNRFDGELGVMLLKFNKESLSFAVQQKQKDEKSKSGDIEDDGDSVGD